MYSQENNVHLSNVSSGLSLDTKLKYQPESTSPFILNGVLESTDGDYPTITNEKGTAFCNSVKAGYTIIGAQQLDGDDILIFSTDNTYSEIGLLNQVSCNYTTLVNATCLNFSSKNRIKSLFRIFKGCERLIYFTDGVNPYRVINIDSLSQYYNNNNEFECEELSLSRQFSYPQMSLLRVNDGGGNTPLGTYRFRIRYLDENLNPTPWMLLTDGVPIVDESLYGDFYQVDGGQNIEIVADDDGGVPITKKSITLKIENLDQGFTFYQIGVLARIDSLGKTTKAYILQEEYINSPIEEFTYRGVDISSDILTTLEELTIDAGIVDIVEAHAQIDNRLFLANFTYGKYDYALLQRAANTIGIEWVTKPVNWEDNLSIENGGSGKNPFTYTNARTFIADEVYAFGIRGHHKKGWSTPVFHIPGRTTINDIQLINLGNDNKHVRNKVNVSIPNQSWDKQLLEVVPRHIAISPNINSSTQSLPDSATIDVWDAQHVEPKVGNKIERWKAYNTAIKYQDGYSGIMAYHESDKDYPDTVDCTGERVFPEGKIRHHRFPDRMLTGLYSNTKDFIHTLGSNESGLLDEREDKDAIVHILPIGYRPLLDEFFDALTDKIKNDFTEWEIMVSIRNDSDKTVLDSGYLLTGYPENAKSPNTTNVSTWFSTCQVEVEGRLRDKYAMFVSPKALFNKEYLNGSHYTNQLQLSFPYSGIGIDSLNGAKIFGNFLSGNEIFFLDLSSNTPIIPDIADPITNPLSKFIGFKHRIIEESSYLSTFTPLYGGDSTADPFENVDLRYRTQSGSFVVGILGGNTIVNKYFNNNLFISRLRNPTISSLLFLESNEFSNQIVSGTATTISISYVNMKKQVDSFSNIYAINYRPTNSRYKYFASKINVANKPLLSYPPNFSGDGFIGKMAVTYKQQSKPFNPDDVFNVSGDYFNAFYESEINVDLRHEASRNDQKYFKKNLRKANLDHLYNFIKQVDPAHPDNSDQDHYFKTPEYWGYNKDYSGVSDEAPGFPIQPTYDYCSKCDNRFPFRIKYSEKSFQEQTIDYYKKFLNLNYTDLPGDTLSINNLFVDKNELYAHTPKALYFISTRAQQIQTNENNLYIGTGDIFSIPPRRLVSLSYAYGGSTDPWATTTTEAGTFFVDSLSGKIFQMSEGLVEISNNGMRNYFENNLKLELDEQCKKFYNKEYPFKSPTDILGIGYHMVYDTRHRRLILHKRDFKIIDPDKYKLTDGGMVSNDIFNTPVNMFDSSVFENKSFTISYSLPNKAWASFHSYMPDYMWNTESDFYASKQNEIFKHNIGRYQTYYDGVKKDFIIDLIANPTPANTKKFEPIILVHDCQEFDINTNTYNDLYDTSFNKVIFYGSDITTGLLTLEKQTDFSSVLNTDLTKIYYERKGREFFINKINDMVTVDVPIFTKDWNSIAPQYFIDKVINSNAINLNASLFNKSRMTDQFMGVRLFFNHKDNVKMTFESMITTFKPFIR